MPGLPSGMVGLKTGCNGRSLSNKKSVSPTPVQEERQPAPAGDDYQIILTRNIFKARFESGGRPGGSSQTDVEDLAETKLRLVLLGTVTGDKGVARAIIRDEKTKLEDLYQVGSEVQGAAISRISRGKVVLQVNGREEVLTIKDPENGDQDQGGTARMETRTPGVWLRMSPSREIENKVPEAQPRRRISFRNPGSAPPTAEKAGNPVPEEDSPKRSRGNPFPPMKRLFLMLKGKGPLNSKDSKMRMLSPAIVQAGKQLWKSGCKSAAPFQCERL